jgi:hypothetical protein
MTERIFDRDGIACFRFVDCAFDARSGVARLVYAFDDGPQLVETITIPGAPFVVDGARAEAGEQALRLLHLLLLLQKQRNNYSKYVFDPYLLLTAGRCGFFYIGASFQ